MTPGCPMGGGAATGEGAGGVQRGELGATMRMTILVALALSAAAPVAAARADQAPRSVTATHVSTPPRVDGVLDDSVWSTAPVLDGFVQREPRDGAPVTESTAVRVVFDDVAIYFAAELGDADPAAITAALHGRDLWKLAGLWDSYGPDDSLAILLDTFGDGRNGYYFAVNPNGAMTDALVTGEGLNKNFEWDGVWRAAARRDGSGWTAEIAIPFRTLRYGSVDERGELTFGLNLQRVIRRKNEEAFWAPIGLSGTLWWFSHAGRLAGLRPPPKGQVAELKPFLVADAARTAARGPATVASVEPGLDARFGLTSGLTLDLTVNTDFAQVEVDQQQINFTRFSLFFPEKREFFLESAGIFNFGFRNESKLFFSRRIGLDDRGREVPMVGGAKLAGKTGPYEIGAIVARTADAPGAAPATYTVARVRRQLYSRSAVGAMVTDVHGRQPGSGNQVAGLDADLTMLKYLTVNAFWARAIASGAGHGDDQATSVYVHWDTDPFGVQYIFHDFGADFAPALGFFPRVNVRRESPGARVAWRPGRGPVRRYLVRGILDWYHDQDGIQRTRHHLLHGIVTLENGDEITVQGDHYTESPAVSFLLGRDTVVPPGVYPFNRGMIRYAMSPGRRYGATTTYAWGGFYGGTRRQVDVRATAKVTDHLAILPTYERNEIDAPFGAFVSNLAGFRVNFNVSNRLITHAFVQYNDVIQRVTLNLRLDFIYRPNSHVYLVWNEGHDTSPSPAGLLLNDRTVILKVVHLIRR